MEFAVQTAQITLIVLASYLLLTVAKLARQDRQQAVLAAPAQSNSRLPVSRPLPRIEGIAQLQMFAGSQMLELRMNGLDPVRIRRKEWLLSGICHYFLGACQAIAHHVECPEDVDEMLNFILRRNLQLEPDEAAAMLDTVLFRPVKDFQQQAARIGAAAAEHWLENKRVPQDLSLFNSIAEWGMTV